MLKKSSPKDGFIKDYSKSYITESNFNISNYPKMKEYYTDLLKNIVIGIDEELVEINNENEISEEEIITDFSNISIENAVNDIRNDHYISMEEYANWKFANWKRKRHAYPIWTSTNNFKIISD